MKQNHALRRTRQKGFTLLEILLVLVLGGVLVIGAFSQYSKAHANSLANTETKNLSTVIGGVKGLYTSSANYSSLTTAVGVNGQVFPSNMIDPSAPTAPINAWKGAVTLAPGAAVGTLPANATFTITENAVPKDECNQLVNAMGISTYTITVDGTTVQTAGGQVDVAATATQCATTDSNTIVFTST